MSLLAFALVAGFILGCGYMLSLAALLRGGMHPTVVAVLAIAGPVLALFLGFTA